MLSTLQAKTARNVSYIGFSQLASLLLSLGTIAILAKLLTPEDFGIIGVGMVFLTLFYSFQDFGVMPALIRRDDRLMEAVSVGLTLRWVMSVLIAVIVVGCSPLIAWFFGDPAISYVIIAYTANLFILNFGFTSQTYLTRSLKFSCLAFATMGQYLAVAVVSVMLALAGFSYWSLVFGSLAGSLSYVVLLRFYERTPVKARFDRKIMNELLDFGKHILVSGLMTFVVFNFDQAIVGRALGVASLGIYFLAVRFGRTIGQQIAGAVNAVMFPTMARSKEDTEFLKTGYTQSIRMIAVLAVPVTVGLSVLSPFFVNIVLGSKWLAVVIPLSILSFQGLLNALIPPAANVLMSIGKPRYMSIQSTIQAGVILVGVYPAAILYGVVGVCLLTTIASLGVLIYFLLVLSSILDTSVADIARGMAPALAAGALTFMLLLVLTTLLPETVVVLVVLSILGMALYVVALHVASRGRDIRDFLDIVRNSICGEK